tara:strand:- start:43 stop:366 length:324 start_codon:yes stop_codon:yes gene_type:complete
MATVGNFPRIKSSYSVQKASNLSLGQGGCLFEDGTAAITGKTIVAIQFLTDSTFSSLTPIDSNYIGTSGGNGDDIDGSNIFPAGMTIYGQWTGFTLGASSSVVAYLG